MSDAYAATARVADILKAAGVPYAIGGSIAMAASGYARMTVDGDINVFVPMEDARAVFTALHAAGVDVDVDAAASAAAERGDGRIWVDGIRIDLFFDSIPLHETARGRLTTVWIGDRSFPALSPEDLVVLKALFGRAKDWVDITRVIAAMGQAFDARYCRAQLVAHAGPEDASVAQLDAVLAEWHDPDGAGARKLAQEP